MPIFHCQEGSSNKSWEYTVNGLTVTIQWGRVGGPKSSQVKSFGSSGAMWSFINSKVQEKIGKGYKETSEQEMKKEVQTAQALGIENKINSMEFVDLRGSTLNIMTDYDPKKYVYVEILNSWSKEVTRLLLSRTESWVITGSITKVARKISFSARNAVYGEAIQFANAVRQKLKELANTVTEQIRTVKFAAVGVRSLFDDDGSETAAAAPLLDTIAVSGCNRSVVSKFAALGQRTLDL